jgi:hypothetical protein
MTVVDTDLQTTQLDSDTGREKARQEKQQAAEISVPVMLGLIGN